MSNSKIIWDFLKKEGFNDFGVAGLMGNLDAESALRPNNLQDTYSRSLGLSDAEYTAKVDNGTYTNFVKDSAGYGLAQWTYWSRKQNLLDYAKSKKKSIGDLEMQLEFLVKELKTSYTNSVYNILKNATSVQQASDVVLMNFERPANAAAKKTQRAQMGQVYYNQYAKGVENTIMGHNTYKKGQKTKLSANFSSTEFDCHGKGCCSETIIDSQLVEYVQQIRDHFGKPITITSGYRCATHNRNVGGATGSRHSKGDAADIVVGDTAPAEVAKYAESIGIKGIGLYETNKDGHFVHIDTRETKSFWYGQGQAKRTTFGGGSSTPTPTPAPQSDLLRFGSEGDDVKELQEDLIKLGYDLGKTGADGDFGTKTLTAVKDFQEKHNLKIDGIVGSATKKAIKEAVANMSDNTIIVPEEEELKLEVGMEVMLANDAVFTNGKSIASWMFGKKLFVRKINGDNITISTVKTGPISGIVDKKYLKEYDSELAAAPGFDPYVVAITGDVVNVRAGAGTNYKVNTQVKQNQLYTIIDEKDGWGKMKNGSGWISLEFTRKIEAKK